MSAAFMKYHLVRLLLATTLYTVSNDWGTIISSIQHGLIRVWGLPSPWRERTFPRDSFLLANEYIARAIDGNDETIGETPDTLNSERFTKQDAVSTITAALMLLEVDAQKAINSKENKESEASQ